MKVNNITPLLSHNNFVSFKAQTFQLNKFDDVNCAYCGEKMLSRGTINQMFDINSYLTTEMYETAVKNKKYLRPFPKKVLEFIEKFQERNKLKTDAHILNHAKRLASYIVENDLISKYDTIKNLVNAFGDETQKHIVNSNEKNMKEILSNTRCYAKLYFFIYGSKELYIRKNDTITPLGKAINAIIKDMDNSSYSIPCYIMNNIRGKTPNQFYKDLFLESESTMEHIQPKSKNGTNKISNYLCICRKCNSDRKNISLIKYAKSKPDVPIKKNIDDQLEYWFKEIPKLINDNKLPKEYENYSLDARKTLINLYNGKFGHREIVIHL